MEKIGIKRILFGLLAVFISFTALGDDYVPVPPKGAVIPAKTAADKVMRTKPYLQAPANDAMTIMWLTNVPCRSWVEYGADTLDMSRAAAYDNGIMVADNKINRIRLQGLEQGRRYYYRVCSQEILYYSSYYKAFGDTVRSATNHFTTWSDNMTDFTAVIFNDVHRRMATFDKLCSLVENVDYDFVFFNGDCINDCEKESQVVDAVAGYGERFGGERIPSIYIRGNHETRGAMSLRLRDYLEPVNGEQYTAFSVGDTRFVILDCGEDKPDGSNVYFGMNDFTGYRAAQTEFVRRETASKEFRKSVKRILIHHIPIYGRVEDKYNPCLEMWHPVLAKAPFDIAINAHQHKYRFVPKGETGNNFPAVIGGGYKPEDATVMVLDKRGGKLTLKVMGCDGKILLDTVL